MEGIDWITVEDVKKNKVAISHRSCLVDNFDWQEGPELLHCLKSQFSTLFTFVIVKMKHVS